MWKICQKYDTKSTDEKYYKCGHIHRCKTKFTQIGQTQKWMDMTHKKSCNEDTFSTPPFIFEKIKKWRNMEYG